MTGCVRPFTAGPRPIGRIAALFAHYPGTVAFSVIFITLLPLTPFGLDITDPGYHLTSQLLATEFWLRILPQEPLIWLSHIIGGIWLRIWPNLLWARIGGLLCMAATAGFAVSLVSRYFLQHWLVPLGALCLVPFFANWLGLISYDTVPSLLTLIFVALYLPLLSQPAFTASGMLRAAIAGLLLFATILSRVTTLSLLVFPPLTVAVTAIWHRERLTRVAIVCVTTLLAVAGWAGAFVLLVLLQGPSLVAAIEHAPLLSEGGLRTGYTPFHLLVQMANQIGDLLPDFGWLPLAFLAFCGALRVACRWWFAAIGALASTVGFLWVYLAPLGQWIGGHPKEGVINLIALTTITLLSLIVIAILRPTEIAGGDASLPIDKLEAKVLVLAGLMLPPVCMAGSAAGILKFHFAASMAGPLALASLVMLAMCMDDAVWRNGVMAFAILFVSTAIATAYWHDLTLGILRDNPNRLQLLYPVHGPRLAGVFTGKARRDSFEALVQAVRSRTKPGDRIFVFGNLPMIYFATATRPLFNATWIEQYSPRSIARFADRLCIAESFPKLIVIGKSEFGNPYWGLRPDIKRVDPPPYDEIYATLHQAVERCRFHKVFDNTDFDVLEPGSAEPAQLTN